MTYEEATAYIEFRKRFPRTVAEEMVTYYGCLMYSTPEMRLDAQKWMFRADDEAQLMREALRLTSDHRGPVPYPKAD